METFDFAATLPQHTASPHTQRAYYRWIDRFLVDHLRLEPTRGEAREARMHRLPLKRLLWALEQRRFHIWLNELAQEGHSRQGLDQARAAMLTLASALVEAGHLDAERVAQLQAVHAPPVKLLPTDQRVLTAEDVQALIDAAGDIATSEAQRQRNRLIAAMLCRMILRREELAATRWDDLKAHEQRVYLNIRAIGQASRWATVPKSVVNALDHWRQAVIAWARPPAPHTPLIRRVWKGGRVAQEGLTSDGIWLVIRDAARYAQLGHVTPDDLRRSAAARLRDAGIPVENISRMMRHRNTLITERFLARLPADDHPKDET